MSQEIVGRIQTSNRRDELAALQRQLSQAEASLPGMSGFERRDTEAAIQRMRTRIEQMQKELNGG
jgi:phage shock protein A